MLNTLKSNKNKNLVAVYIRTSNTDQSVKNAIEVQLSAIREFAEKNDYNIIKEYIDYDCIGNTLARPQLDQLRQDVKRGLWDTVLIYDRERLTRRYSHQELIVDELREAGAEVIFVTMPPPDNNEDKILRGIMELFTEYEKVKKAEWSIRSKLYELKNTMS